MKKAELLKEIERLMRQLAELSDQARNREVMTNFLTKHLAYVSLLAFPFLTACATAPLPAGQQLQIACAGWPPTLQALAVQRSLGKLTPAQIAHVEQWRPALNSACSDNPGPVDLAGVQAALAEMIRIQEAAR